MLEHLNLCHNRQIYNVQCSKTDGRQYTLPRYLAPEFHKLMRIKVDPAQASDNLYRDRRKHFGPARFYQHRLLHAGITAVDDSRKTTDGL